MLTKMVIASICGALLLYTAGDAYAETKRAKGEKPRRVVAEKKVTHPKGTICPKTGQLILARK